MQHRPRLVALLGLVGQDFDADRTTKPVDAPNESDRESFLAVRRAGFLVQMISSETGSPSRAAVTLSSVRSAFATLPFRPIT
jgi:hypothetical protein